MEFESALIYQWLFNTPCRALDRAYNASKTIRNIQTQYVSYKEKTAMKYSWYNITLYMNTVLEESVAQIYWGLLEFQVSRFILYTIPTILFQNSWKLLIKQNGSLLLLDNNAYQNFTKYADLNQMSLQPMTRKLAWIEAVLNDLNVFKDKYSTFLPYILDNRNTVSNLLSPTVAETIPKRVAYESVGLVPRSITRTLSRFQIELAGRSASLVLPEFRLVKYQANASIQYLACLLLLPWMVSMICKVLILQPLVESWWDTAQSQVFLNTSQEQKALTRLQEIEELLWLDIVVASTSKKQLQDLSGEIHQKTIELVDVWNRDSIHTVLHLLTDLISITCVVVVLIWGKKRLAILNSWVQELFYSLSDTMKAFFILLLTDLCIGFHSPHGWEILIAWLLEHLGFAHNKHVISCFVSTFPVILDTVFKYWIFRHLNRISPSIVVTYHTMNE